MQVSIGGRKVRTLGMGDYVGMAPRCGFIMKIRWFEGITVTVTPFLEVQNIVPQSREKRKED